MATREGIDGLRQIATGLGNAALLTEPVFRAVEGLSCSAFQQLAGEEGEDGALRALQPLAQVLLDLAYVYELRISGSLEELMERSEAAGLEFRVPEPPRASLIARLGRFLARFGRVFRDYVVALAFGMVAALGVGLLLTTAPPPPSSPLSDVALIVIQVLALITGIRSVGPLVGRVSDTFQQPALRAFFVGRLLLRTRLAASAVSFLSLAATTLHTPEAHLALASAYQRLGQHSAASEELWRALAAAAPGAGAQPAAT